MDLYNPDMKIVRQRQNDAHGNTRSLDCVRRFASLSDVLRSG